jgi:hypothetical protein
VPAPVALPAPKEFKGWGVNAPQAPP